MSMRVACVQFCHHPSDVEENFTRVEDYIRQASEDNVDLIVFPECFLGYSKIPDPLPRLGTLAKTYALDIVTGTYLYVDPESGKRYNRASYIDKDGEVLMSYDKVHLWHGERGFIEPGKQFPTVVNRFGIRVGLLICWDLTFADGFSNMVLDQGAQLVVIPAMWSYEDAGEVGQAWNHDSEVALIDSMTVARAFEFQVPVVFCNMAAARSKEELPVDKEDTECGHSQISMPFKGSLIKANHNHEALLAYDIPVAQITKDAEEHYKIRADWLERPKKTNE
ncbi:carbon-nitrogen hydrolase [Hesseltinella vesiculosa]|uniref:Carbon-nitrogen hydrolase n=1 Tax=Hesseltinella vesiculosa TaxID=101127 RepID=A0A1X2GC12_9FUNG|nr:carbon-nitrogen hydrolase [Hesseltinella vesiculosa]